MSKHTPGPWTTSEDDYGDERWFGGKGRGEIIVGKLNEYGLIDGWVSGGCKHKPDEWERLQADARLIAAAPNLLEALRGLADLYDTDEGCRSLPQYQAARAAIAKAEGRS